jgi:hypothetical protein
MSVIFADHGPYLIFDAHYIEKDSAHTGKVVRDFAGYITIKLSPHRAVLSSHGCRLTID